MTGSLIYVFVGQDVRSPALLSAGETMAKVAFGLALPVIFISGSINSTVAGRYIHGRIYKDSVTRFINTKKGWISWIAIITSITIAAFIIAESIPFFEDLLSLSSALFISGFSYYFPAVFWFMLIKEGKWYERKNLMLSIANGLVFILGMTILVAGTYVSIDDIVSSRIFRVGWTALTHRGRNANTARARCTGSFPATRRESATLALCSNITVLCISDDGLARGGGGGSSRLREGGRLLPSDRGVFINWVCACRHGGALKNRIR